MAALKISSDSGHADHHLRAYAVVIGGKKVGELWIGKS